MEWETLRIYHGPYELYEWPGYLYPEAFLIIREGEYIWVKQSPPNPPEDESVLVVQQWILEPLHRVIWERSLNSLNLSSAPYDKAPSRYPFDSLDNLPDDLREKIEILREFLT